VFWPFAVALVIAVVVGQVGRFWVLRRHQAGALSARAAAWITAGLVITPFALITIFAVVTGVEWWWVFVILFVLTAPVFVMPWMAIYLGPEGRGRNAPGPRP
jgi:hypothetical protein